jgi:hypothetical protein
MLTEYLVAALIQDHMRQAEEARRAEQVRRRRRRGRE